MYQRAGRGRCLLVTLRHLISTHIIIGLCGKLQSKCIHTDCDQLCMYGPPTLHLGRLVTIHTLLIDTSAAATGPSVRLSFGRTLSRRWRQPECRSQKTERFHTCLLCTKTPNMRTQANYFIRYRVLNLVCAHVHTGTAVHIYAPLWYFDT